MQENLIINNNEKLKEVCNFIKKNINILAVDTEFIRQNTYFPCICLIQIAYYYNNKLITYLIDTTLEDINLGYFFIILKNKNIKKIIHSSEQDIEAFIGNKLCKKINNIQDTQIMAEFCGDVNIGYVDAITKYMNILNFQKDKNIQSSNWKKRPLTEEQIEYAKKDVFYLIDLYKVLYKKLEKENKLIFYENEMKYFLQRQNTNYYIQNSWKKLKFAIHKINYNEFELAKDISNWREEKAINENISRNLIFDNNLLMKLVKDKPFTKEIFRKNFSQYKKLLSLRREYKKEIINIIQKHVNNIDKNNDKKIFYIYKKKFPLMNKYKKIEDVVNMISKNMNIKKELLLTQHDIIFLITKDIPKRKILYGWKYTILNQYL